MSEVIALENQLENYKELVERRRIALRLFDHPDFKKLILDQFCVQECARYAQLSADPSMGPNERADSLALAQAAGHLKRFLSVTVQMGAHAENTMKDLEDEIAEARAEEGNA